MKPYSPPQSGTETTLNTFKVYIGPIFAGALATVTIALCYFISVNNGTTGAWPKTDITHSARYPPAEYIFRIGIPVAMVILQQVWWVMWSWIHAESVRLGVSTGTENAFFILGVVGANLLIVASVLIQPGDMDWTLHTIGATGFFLCTFLAQLMATFKLKHLRKHDNTVTTDMSMRLKKHSVGYIFFVLLIDGLSGLGYFPFWPYLGNILEYTLTLLVLIWFISCSLDFKDRLVLNLVLKAPAQSTV